jgi:Family of unknown function (DUF5681)
MELGGSAQRGIGLVSEGNEATRFKPGQSGNPKGRPRGSRHKISEAFVADLLADYQNHGRQAIERMRKKSPTAYIRMIASLVPKQVVDTAPNPLEHLTIEELNQLESYLESIANKGENGVDPEVDRAPPH